MSAAPLTFTGQNSLRRVPSGCELQALYHFRGSEDRLLKNGHWIGPTYREQPLKLVSSNTYRGAVPR